LRKFSFRDENERKKSATIDKVEIFFAMIFETGKDSLKLVKIERS